MTQYKMPYVNSYGEMVYPDQKCKLCDGTGEVHSHNPRCWGCHGTGHLTSEKQISKHDDKPETD